MVDLKLIRTHLRLWEGEISHLYLDTKGLVTIGVGHLVGDISAACELGFVYRSGGSSFTAPILATCSAVEADIASVRRRPAGLVARAYRPYTRLDLPDEKLCQLLESDVSEKESGIARALPEFHGYPASAQVALLDMAFNLGVTGLIRGFPRLVASVRRREWLVAAKQCHRRGPSEDRNAETARLFRRADQEQQRGELDRMFG